MKPALNDGDILDSPKGMGLLQERLIGNTPVPVRWSRDCLFFPRNASRFQVISKSHSFDQTVDTSQLLFLPANSDIVVIGKSPITMMVACFPSATLREELLTENKLDRDADKFLRTRCFKLKRSRWIDDLVERYIFERFFNRLSPDGCTFFLEKQILNEMARLIFTDKIQTHGETLGEEPSDIFLRALQFIETNLSESLDIESITKTLNVEASTLSRLFKKQLNTTPGAYIKDRRLEEAAAMIARSDYNIADICVLIGYEDISSFTRSFKAKFGVPPGSYREQAALGLYMGKGT